MHSVQLKNNPTAWFYRGDVQWDKQNPWLVLVHGAGMHHGFWQMQARYLACRGINVCAVDLPGHGHASADAGMKSIEDYADWLGVMLSTLMAPPVTVTGHSMGACIAITLAARYADQVRSVVTVGGGIQIPVHKRLLETVKNSPKTVAAFMAAHSQSTDNALGARSAPGLWITGSATAVFSHCNPTTYHDDLAACAAWQGSDYAAKVRQPGLVLCGAKDRMLDPKQGRALAEALPQAVCETWPEAGHLPTFEASQRMRTTLLDWVKMDTPKRHSA